MKVTYKNELNHYWDYYFITYKLEMFCLLFSIILIKMILIAIPQVAVLRIFAGKENIKDFLYLMLVISIIILLIFVWIRYKIEVKRISKRENDDKSQYLIYDEEITIEINNGKFIAYTNGIKYDLEISKIDEIMETKKFFYIKFYYDIIFLIPKSVIDKEDDIKILKKLK